ncbi:histidine kinase [Variovorax sp. WS11]|uniref:CBS domain-containing protein n=1 Tax=Variovorax sp. WS11 TaxID=1105204 RepID=UPI000D0D890F|nr:CBS domain-containing protein [Variovorax sp. WS11]NDZ17873.1 CBS domain-containing protein [Variovorax sp. WS11]PSL81341.1 histidine kinase [Variovorax sp. WS11]
MNAADIMTTPVVTIGPDAQIREIAALLLEKRISGVPVVDGGRVIGFVNEADLLRRHEIGTDAATPERSWWAQLIRPERLSFDYVKTHAGRARDIMTRDVVAVAEDTPLQRIATILAARHVRRVPVLRSHQLVGIVTRADLVRAIARKPRNSEAPAQTDEDIRQRLLAELEKQPWWHPDWSAVDVLGGIVTYRGLLESEGERQAARVAAENVPGVRGVEDNRTPWAAWQSFT